MDEKYWNEKAKTYKDEIFSVLAEDRSGVVLANIKKMARPDAIVGDFGCGIGHFLSVLSPLFKRVFAYDLSANCIKNAKVIHADLLNVQFQQADLCKNQRGLRRVDFGLCVNAMMMPSLKMRQIFLSNLRSAIKKGGHLCLVVPSFESYHYVNFRLHQKNISQGIAETISLKALEDSLPKQKRNIIDGVICLDHVETKHYLADELDVLLRGEGFLIKKIKRVEFDWSTESDQLPSNFGGPQPFDWMVVAQKQ